MVWQTRGEIRGPVGTFDHATGLTLPPGSPVTVDIGGTPEDRTLTIGVPEGKRGLPGLNGVPTDEAVAEYAVTEGTALNAGIKAAVGGVLVKPGNLPVPSLLAGMSPGNRIRADKAPSPTLNVVGSAPENMVKVGDTYWLLYSQATAGVSKLHLASSSSPDGPWAPYSGNPILASGTQAWEGDILASTNGGSLMEHGGIFYLYYCIDTREGTTPSIGVATAPAVTGPYTKHAGNPLVPLGAAGEWDSLRIQEPHVIVGPDGTWVMAYMAETTLAAQGTSEQVGIATAPGPFGPWTKAANNPMIGFGTVGIWDIGGTADPSLIYDNGYYWCLYSGLALNGVRPWQLGLAYAKNPLGPWTRHESNPIVPRGEVGDVDRDAVWRGAIFKEDGIYHLPYGMIAAGGSGVTAKGGNARLVFQDAVPPATEITAKVNMVTNPSREVDLSNVAYLSGTGATSALTRPTTGGKRGAGFARQTWSVGTTGPGCGIYDIISGLKQGRVYSGGVWARSSIETLAVFRCVFRNAGGGGVSIEEGDPVLLAPGVWTRLVAENMYAVPGTVSAFAEAWTVAGEGYVNFAAGDTLDSDSAMFNEGPILFDDFDGASAAADGVTYAWKSTAHASPSYATTRPAPDTVKVGTVGFDPRRGIPVWSTGDAWVDATGAPV